MRRTKKGVSPSLDVMEPRVLLSHAAPLLSRHAMSGVVREVRAIASTQAETRHTVEASAHFARVASRFPSGPEGGTPSLRRVSGHHRAHSARSILAKERRLLGKLYRAFHGVEGGHRPVTGSGTTTYPTPGYGTGGTTTTNPPGHGMGGTTAPVPVPSLDSVRIQNTTGLALRVTVHLDVPQIQKPWITEVIPAQGSSIVLFNFGTATNAFMTMDVSRADGGQTPPPFTNVSLSQPMSGYNGALFTISLIGPYFNVTPP
jgi:hypothetical protein